MQIKVAPSILDCDLTRLAESVAEVESGGVDMHHVDVADGHFVPNIMAGPQFTAAVCRCAQVPVNVHLMISDPVRYAPYFIEAGAASVLFHVEAVEDLPAAVEAIRGHGAKVGVALKPDTPAQAVAAAVGMLDCLMAMTVQPGFSGQSFMEEGCHKIPELRRMFGSDIDIYVDGGIGPRDGAPGGALRGQRAGRLLGHLPGGRGPGGGGRPARSRSAAQALQDIRQSKLIGTGTCSCSDARRGRCRTACSSSATAAARSSTARASRSGCRPARSATTTSASAPGPRVKMLTDEGSFQEIDADLVTCDPLGFVAVKAYKDQIPQYMERSGLNEAVAERHLHDRGAAGRLRGHGLRLLRRQHGQRGRARRSRARPSWPPRSGCPW